MTLPAEPTSDAATLPPFARISARMILLVALLGAVPGMLVTWYWRGHFSTASTVGEFVIYTGVALAVIALARSRGVRIGRLFGPRPTGRALLLAAGLAIVVLAFSLGTLLSLVALISFVMPDVLDKVREDAPGFMVHSRGQVDLVATIAHGAIVALLAPLVEELLFRGLVFTRWAHRYDTRRGLLFSAILFGLLHFVLQPLGAFVLALVAGLLYLKTRSLWTAIAAHATNNTIVVLASSWGEQQVARSAALPEGSELMGLLACGVVLVVVSLPILLVAFRRLWPARDTFMPYDDTAPAGG